VKAVENEFGTYNSTFRVELAAGAPVYLRVAPPADRQLRSERQFMRNEHAGIPFLAPIAPLLPLTLGVDFTHEIVDRDYVIQSELVGTPAPDGLDRYPRDKWVSFFRDMGSIARSIHAVRGDRFGFMIGPSFASWSDALLASLEDVASDHTDLGLASQDVHALAGHVSRHRSTLDQISEPRLLHGDLWTVNVTISDDAPLPRIVGVCDWDRMSWGDPLADWTIFMARKRPGTERDGFWQTYGSVTPTLEATVRNLIYTARHLLMVRLERIRLGKVDDIATTYQDVNAVLLQIPT